MLEILHTRVMKDSENPYYSYYIVSIILIIFLILGIPDRLFIKVLFYLIKVNRYYPRRRAKLMTY